MSENEPSIKTVWSEVGEVYEISISSPCPQFEADDLRLLAIHSELPLPDCDMADTSDAKGQHWSAPKINPIEPK
jgi:hypothetical protein